MDYLFFDIECANCYQGNGKICSFGYVLCDEDFNVIKKEDIVINPKSKFNLKGRRGTPDLVLAYSEDEFKAAPKFVYYYPFIKKLLEAPNRLVVGHALINDVNFLNYETRRYKCPSFDFEFLDSQVLYGEFSDSARQRGLDKIAEDLHIEFLAHRSDEDSYATLLYVKYICEHFSKTLPELVAQFGITLGALRHYAITPTISDGQKRRLKVMAREDSIRNQTLNLAKFLEKLQPKTTFNDRDVFRGKIICFNDELEQRNFTVTKEFIRMILAKGGIYTQNPEECNLFVLGKRPNDRQVVISNAVEKGQDVELITELEFTTKIGTTFYALKRKLFPPIPPQLDENGNPLPKKKHRRRHRHPKVETHTEE